MSAQSAPHLRARSFSELIDATFHVVRARFRVLVTAAALVMVPTMAATLIMTAFTPDAPPAASEAAPAGSEAAEPSVSAGALMTTTPGAEPPDWVYAVVLPLFVAGFVAYVIGFGAMIHIAARAYLGEAVEVGPAFARARGRFWSLLRAMLTKYIRAAALVVLPGAALAILIPRVAAGGGGSTGFLLLAVLLVPVALVFAFIVLLRYVVTGPVVMHEDVGGKVALERSAALTRGAKARLFGMFFVLFVLMYTVMATLMFGGMVLTGSPIVGQVLGNLASLVTYPFAAALLTVVYFDLRIRNEAFDLELMAGGLQDAVPASALPSAPATSRQPA